MLGSQMSKGFLPRSGKEMLPSVSNKLKRNLANAHARNVVMQNVQGVPAESTAKILARIVGRWNVMDATASIL